MYTNLPSLSLYVHLPWCIQKCPYCDFNSHAMRDALPETLYINALLQELEQHAAMLKKRPLTSIFFGGGTPSLFSADAIARILHGISQYTAIDSIEITLEANPGTIDQTHFPNFRKAGINRLSLGIQSLQDDKLHILGRIHDRNQALLAIDRAFNAGFTNVNFDLMYGLPNQTLSDALSDIKTALSFQPTHFSWYQLTIEPNTLFYKQRPKLPEDDTIWEMQTAGQTLINELGYSQYEVSAYANSHFICKHNYNYWEFGDYLGIGAGAHSKITDDKQIVRFAQVKHPRDYLNPNKSYPTVSIISEKDLIFEFMLNALRLTNGVPIHLFAERTGIPFEKINPMVKKAQNRGLMSTDTMRICATPLGMRFLNDLVEIFLV